MIPAARRLILPRWLMAPRYRLSTGERIRQSAGGARVRCNDCPEGCGPELQNCTEVNLVLATLEGDYSGYEVTGPLITDGGSCPACDTETDDTYLLTTSGHGPTCPEHGTASWGYDFSAGDICDPGIFFLNDMRLAMGCVGSDVRVDWVLGHNKGLGSACGDIAMHVNISWTGLTAAELETELSSITITSLAGLPYACDEVSSLTFDLVE